MLPDFKLYYKAMAIKTLWCSHENRHTDQRNRTESPEVNPHLYGQLISDKAAKNLPVSSINCIEKIGQERMKLDHFLTPYIKINTKLD